MGAPSPDRVVQDVYLAFKAHEIVYKANGKMVPGLTNRNGHRYNKEGSMQWGGARIKSYEVGSTPWLEPGAQEVSDERQNFTKSRFLEPV